MQSLARPPRRKGQQTYVHVRWPERCTLPSGHKKTAPAYAEAVLESRSSYLGLLEAASGQANGDQTHAEEDGAYATFRDRSNRGRRSEGKRGTSVGEGKVVTTGGVIQAGDACETLTGNAPRIRDGGVAGDHGGSGKREGVGTNRERPQVTDRNDGRIKLQRSGKRHRLTIGDTEGSVGARERSTRHGHVIVSRDLGRGRKIARIVNGGSTVEADGTVDCNGHGGGAECERRDKGTGNVEE